ncbi:hypothetical protein CHARACLAT_004764 [Characodon lateralis]|uniref:G-protein coupled receptors family 1 profile domain-containing protein n=1 Tax=Characodon lateralis TaxID=208331 RepID=A0ABU7CUU6_9TELE|nr:hypothetical protein [Characodon lateralis]
MIGLNIRLFIIATFQLGREPPSDERDNKRSSVYLILLVAAFFLAAWIPLFCHIIVCNFTGTTCYTFRNEGTDPLRILPRVNTALTPVLYLRGCKALRVAVFSTVWRPCLKTGYFTNSLAPLSLQFQLSVAVKWILSQHSLDVCHVCFPCLCVFFESSLIFQLHMLRLFIRIVYSMFIPSVQ